MSRGRTQPSLDTQVTCDRGRRAGSRTHDRAQRAVIADAVRSVVARGGMEAVTLRTVAAEAGVSVSGMQHYFPTRTELLGHALDRTRQRLHARIDARVEGTDRAPRSTLLAVLTELLADHVETREALRMHAAFAVSPVAIESAPGLTGRDDEYLALATSVVADRRGTDEDHDEAADDGYELWTLARGLAFDIALHDASVERARSVLRRRLRRLGLDITTQ